MYSSTLICELPKMPNTSLEIENLVKKCTLLKSCVLLKLQTMVEITLPPGQSFQGKFQFLLDDYFKLGDFRKDRTNQGGGLMIYINKGDKGEKSELFSHFCETFGYKNMIKADTCFTKTSSSSVDITYKPTALFYA